MDYIIYHKDRYEITYSRDEITRTGGNVEIFPTDLDFFTVYCDSFKGNQDPYIWGDYFLHSYCKMNQVAVSTLHPGDRIFWFTRQYNDKDVFQDKARNAYRSDIWYCDLVFIFEEEHFWEKDPNPSTDKRCSHYIEGFDYNHYNLFELSEPYRHFKNYSCFQRMYDDHFSWAASQHNKVPGKTRYHRRVTLRASSDSFQPLGEYGRLISMEKVFSDFGIQQPTLSARTVRKTELSKNQSDEILAFLDSQCSFKVTNQHFKELYDIPWITCKTGMKKVDDRKRTVADVIANEQHALCKTLITDVVNLTV